MGFPKPKVSFLMTIFDCRSNFAKSFLEKAKSYLGRDLLNTVIRSNIKLREAALNGKPIFEYDITANGAKDYCLLAEEVEPELKGKMIELQTPKAKDYATLSKEIEHELEFEPINIDTLTPLPMPTSDSKKAQLMFKLYAPEARSVHLAGSFNDWTVEDNLLMKKLDNGVWVKTVSLPVGTYHYKFVVDGNHWKEDPDNSTFENDKLGGRNSVILVK